MYTNTFSVWIRRLLMHHPLVRSSDRVEAASLLLIVVVALFSVPLVGAVGTAVHDSLSHTFAAQRAERQQVEATVTGDSRVTAQAYDNPYLSPIQWQFNGITHTDEVRTAKMNAGDHLTIWVDSTGERRAAPLSDRDAAVQAVIAAVSLWFTVVGVAVGGWAIVRMRLDRGRYAEWDRDLRGLADNDGRTNNNA
ncbi:MAG: hypothetical protein AB1925_04900 [Actinomycetota bacterium]